MAYTYGNSPSMIEDYRQSLARLESNLEEARKHPDSAVWQKSAQQWQRQADSLRPHLGTMEKASDEV